MFFYERIKSIKPSDRVLEIGPGGTPHPRADVFLDLDPKLFKNEHECSFQRGNAPQLNTEKPIFYYDGKKFPFKDNEFDYVICTHVIEHVGNVEKFLSELFRVSGRGYVEYPTIYYEYLYNFSVHLNLVKKDKNELIYLKKDKTCLTSFLPVQQFFFDSLNRGYVDIVNDLKEYMFEGFEWEGKFSVRKAKSLNELTWANYDLPTKVIANSTYFFIFPIKYFKDIFKKLRSFL